ncbi:MAG: hypothetical protein JWR57_1214, partial [Mycetocola sp.]|nr:hypothetical protein [Mycetocola sp.]
MQGDPNAVIYRPDGTAVRVAGSVLSCYRV